MKLSVWAKQKGIAYKTAWRMWEIRILKDPTVTTIIVEHRDRLMRFGIEYVEAVLAAQGRRLIVIDADEVKDDIVGDLHEVIVSLCARLYGKKSAQNRAKKAIDAVTNG